MGNKHNGSASCESQVVEILLPGENFDDIKINLQRETLNLQSPNFFLNMCLPHPVNPRVRNWEFKRQVHLTIKADKNVFFIPQLSCTILR